MAKRTRGSCSAEGCGRPHASRGWCTMHYTRWYINGDPLAVKKPYRVDVVDGAKRCSRCKRSKQLTDFNHARRNRTGYSAQCRRCQAETRHARLYQITPDQYRALFDSQGGVCAICGGPGNSKGLVIDHDHASGVVRGILCGHCNTALGLLEDNPDRLRRAICYLS